ncbi:hypothetical protein Arub01_42820 [Actinomadura rubrobrunea]|uniref:Chaplin domain-containing protein n=1 Tax=Actinomadura rubrobrunea TaxID=115335 RepID=A0A9W6Q057_9ACTN|nr:chaplin family protein [Actinomadura rubrobrunea]GLW66038.1 hypothetical protein Arub01_42820 [Actinomadura rubrobrunea]
MRTWAKGTAARAALLTAGFVALGAGPVLPVDALADTTNGASSVLGGNQVNVPISAPIDISGNSVAVAGTAGASSQGGARVDNGTGGGGGQATSGRSSVLGGNQVNVPISAPISACGNTVAIIGTAGANCTGSAKVTGNGTGGGGSRVTTGRSGVGSGNQVNAPISAPVDVCGNAIALLGIASANCTGSAKVTGNGTGGGGGQGTSGRSSVLGGNQVNAPISAPVNACGTAVAILGIAGAGCTGGAKVVGGGNGGGQRTTGRSGVGSGNQVNAPVSAPVDVCGNAIGNALASCDGGATVRDGGSDYYGSAGQATSGTRSVLSGNQANAPVAAPVSICGNAAALIGQTGAFCRGGAHTRTGSGGGQSTSGRNSVAGGNQVHAPVKIPANVCGNAAALIGTAAAACKGTSVATGSNTPGGYTTGRGSVGGGNQVTVPAEAPAAVCGNAAAVIGHSEPVCQDDPYGYGYGYRATGPLPEPVAKAPLSLPLTAQAKKALTSGLGTASPAGATRRVATPVKDVPAPVASTPLPGVLPLGKGIS